jgi:hypothetical protein
MTSPVNLSLASAISLAAGRTILPSGNRASSGSHSDLVSFSLSD